MSGNKGGFFVAAAEEAKGSTAASTSSQSNGGCSYEDLPEYKSLLTVDGSGPGVSAETCKEMSEQLHREIEKLTRIEEDEQERLDAVSERQSKLAAAHEKTVLKIEQKKALLESLEGPAHTSLGIKQLQVLEAQRSIKEAKLELEEFEAFAEHRKLKLLAQIRGFDAQVASLKKDIYYIEQRQKSESAPPGPYALKFLDSDKFQVASSMVIMANLVVMYLQATHEDLHAPVLNFCFLAFYVVELMLQLIFKHTHFFYSNDTFHWWNIMDSFIVSAGVIEFLLSALADTRSPLMKWLRVLRLFRLARAVKVIRLFCEDMSWADGHLFHSIMVSIIGLNTITMGLETEYEGLDLWTYVNTTFLFIYIFEIFAKMKLHGLTFFYGDNWHWNWLDLLIVGGGVLYVMVLPSIELLQRTMGMHPEPDPRMEQFINILRMFRLVRILRLGKIIKQIPPLYTLVIGIATAMQGMGWVMVLTVTVLYTCALVGVKLVGQGAILPGDLDSETRASVEKTFSDIPEAIFNLFKVMNADLGGVEPLLNTLPMSKYIMMLYMIVTNWAIFSILTAVVSDNMAKVTDQHSKEEEELEEREQRELRSARVEMLFKRLDVNKDGGINTKELTRIVKDAEAADELERLTGIDRLDFEDFFDLIAKSKAGSTEETISTSEFMTLLEQQGEVVTHRSMMKIERRLTSIESALETINAGGSGSTPSTKRSVA